MIDDQLENWQRYYRDTYARRKTLSLEGRYVIERKDIDYEEEAPPPAKKPVRRKEAEHIEAAIIKLPYTYKLCLTVEYMYRWALHDHVFHKTCAIAKTKRHLWDDIVKKAKLMVENKLTTTY